MKIWLYLAVLISAISTQAQYKLSGIIGMQGGELFSYDLIVHPTQTPNTLSGSVKTYATRAQEVTAAVELVVDKEQKTVSLRETKITANSGFKSNSIICLVRADLTYDEKNGVLKGPILTQTSGDQAYCARGNVIFTNRAEIEALFGIAQTPPKPVVMVDTLPKVIKPTPTPKPRQTTNPHAQPTPAPVATPAPAPKKPAEITEGKDQALQWSSDKVVLEVWDDNQIDGDKVSITVNGQLIVDNLLLKKEKAIYTIDISQHELSVIVIKAVSEGNDPPNTAMLRLLDGSKEHLILSYNDVGKKSLIRIRRQLQ